MMRTPIVAVIAVATVMLSVAFPAESAAAETSSVAEKIVRSHRVVRHDEWHGGRRTVFDFQGHEAWVVEPPANVSAAEGHPWTWTMQWADAYVPRTGVPQMLRKGYCHVTIDTFALRMNAEGLKVSAAFQRFLVEELGFAPKAFLIGMSWGGFFSVRYAANYPQNVAAMYLDCPLLNLDGLLFEVGRTSEEQVEKIGSWGRMGKRFGEWTDDPEMPVNMAAKVAGIPVLLAYGGQDGTLSPRLNSELFISRFKAAGGKIRVDYRPYYGHHPHGFEVDDRTILDFFALKAGCDSGL